MWEWKGPIIKELKCAYGKFFDKKAVFISKDWFLDFANYRRNGYDFDARFDDGLVSYRENELYNLIFVYLRDKKGNPYGWGVAEYSTPEKFFGKSFASKIYRRTPEKSYERLYKHLSEMLPNVSQDKIEKILVKR